MRNAVIGLFVGAGLAVLLLVTAVDPRDVHATQADRLPETGLVPFGWTTAQASFVTVVDPQRRVLSVYEINSTSGAVTLKSVRNLMWDLQLEEFNTTSPSPREIRALVERR